MILTDSLAPAIWFKSSYSQSEAACIEVAHVPAEFHKSSYSGGDNNCIEIATVPAASAIRDTKHRDLGALVFPSQEWRAFISASKADSL